NPLSDSSGSFATNIEISLRALGSFPIANSRIASRALQADAASQTISNGKVVSTDPPYYDNIGYADLSDFFYVWIRRALRPVFPALLATVSVPKTEALVATPIRHGSKEGAEAFFLAGMERAMHRIAQEAHPAF